MVAAGATLSCAKGKWDEKRARKKREREKRCGLEASGVGDNPTDALLGLMERGVDWFKLSKARRARALKKALTFLTGRADVMFLR